MNVLTTIFESIRRFVTTELSTESVSEQSQLQAVANEPTEAPKKRRGRPRKVSA